MRDIATLCVEDVKAKIEAVSAVNRAFHVYSEKELIEKTKSLPTNSTQVNIGIMYEGMKNSQSVPNGGSASSVVSTQMIVSDLICGKPDGVYGSSKDRMAEALDHIREAVRRTKSPTKHAWVFQVEAPAVLNDSYVVWLQRWSTACNL